MVARILDEKGKVWSIEEREDAGGRRRQELAHIGIEAIVYVGEDEVEVGLCAAAIARAH